MTSSSKLSGLPEKPLLSLVIDALDLSHQDAVTQIDTVLQHLAQSSLKLYLPRGLQFAAQRGVEVESVEHQGGYQLMSCGETYHLDTSTSEIQIGHAVLLNTGVVLVDEVVFEDEHYRPLTECQLFVEPLAVNPAHLFAKRSELEEFLTQGQATLPSYLDPSSDLYAPELALAVEIHRELFEKGTHSPALNVEDRVHRWLNMHRQDLSPFPDALVKRMATMINPNKKKGSPFYRLKT